MQTINEKIERAIARGVIRTLARKGFTLANVSLCGDWLVITEEDAAITVIFETYSAGAAALHFLDANGKRAGRVLLVLGNGEDALSDWTTGNEAFDNAVQSFADGPMFGVVCVEGKAS